jgi:hypothetical protein
MKGSPVLLLPIVVAGGNDVVTRGGGFCLPIGHNQNVDAAGGVGLGRGVERGRTVISPHAVQALDSKLRQWPALRPD